MPKVWNETRGTEVCTSCVVADTLWTRLVGLQCHSRLEAGEGMWITPCNSIHSCFMKFRFDAVFVDKTGKVLHLIRAMKPWRMSRVVLGAQSVLELPAGAADGAGIQCGDIMRLENAPGAL
jgi:uncharacterized membrane protein (UPF0127 family)